MRTQEENVLLQNVGQRIVTLRKQQCLTQEIMAEKAGFSRSYYTEIELGKRNISILNLSKIAHALSCSLIDLLQDNNEVGANVK